MGLSPKHSTLINDDNLEHVFDTLCKTPSCRIQIPLDKGVSPNLDEEWLTEGEAALAVVGVQI
eukprot:13068675-Ditylum_brightwellii.AAC.1